jgi:hypothetical protein
MKLRIIEAHGNGLNWGKFAVGQMTDEEWDTRSAIEPDGRQLMASIGYWSRDWLWVLDLQTGEGIFVQPRGRAQYALDKHKVWVCPLYEPFLDWLIENYTDDVDALPREVELPNAPAAMYGYRRAGSSTELETEERPFAG